MHRSWREGGLLVAVLLLQLAAPRTGGTEVGPVAGAVATVAAVGQAALLVRRRRTPLPVALGVLALYAVQVAAADVVGAFALWVALWALAVRGVVRETAAVAGGAVAVVAAAELLREGTGLGVVVAAVTVVVALVALLRRSEQSRLEAVRAQAAAAERLRIAGDLHDLAGHGLGVVAVQSSTARMALDAGDTASAREALAAVETSSRAALKEMRQLLGVLRDGDSTEPAPGLADIAGLVAGVRAGGVDVEARLATVDVPAGIGLCAYRVVQEALTNAVRHSPGAAVRVEVEPRSDVLHVAVVSHGKVVADPGTGAGLGGMRARVSAVGGTSRIGPVDGGWSVEAELPMGAA